MKWRSLLTPVSADAPCGADLLAQDDAGFLGYYFAALARLPGNNASSPTIQLENEQREIAGLLKKSRDIRLLVLMAQFEIGAGEFPAFAETLDGIAAVMEAFPHDAHPVDAMDMADALAELDSWPAVITPLDRAVLLKDQRAGEIRLATWKKPAADTDADEPAIRTALEALAREQNTDKVEGLMRIADGMDDALRRIQAVCALRDGPVPEFARLLPRIDLLAAILTEARPDMKAVDEDGNEGEGEDGTSADMPLAAVTDFDAGRAMVLLRAVESYFLTREPSSAALILVIQARQLVGRPLIEAFDMLLGKAATNARIDFGKDHGFALDIDQIRQISTEITPVPIPDPEPLEELEEPEGEDGRVEHAKDPAPVLADREAAAQAMRRIEEFFRQKEPSSPVPLLLQRARDLIGKDFRGLLSEMLPRDG